MGKFVDVEDEKVRQRVKQLTEDYLGGGWSTIDQNDIKIRRIVQGYVNEIYLCELPSTEEYSNEEHKKIVIKIVEKMEESFEIDLTSLYINYLLAGEANLGPKVLGVFKGGIITEYFEGRNLDQKDDFNNEAVKELAKVLAKFHSLRIPSVKSTSNKWPQMMLCEKGKEFMTMMFGGLETEEDKESINKMLQGISLDDEAKWLGLGLEEVKSPVLCTHTDFNRGNVLVKDDQLEIKLVDLDYSGYNFRGVDFGRYFSCWRQKELLFGFDRFPTDEEMGLFLKAYIKESVNLNGEDYLKKEVNSEAFMIRETKYFTLIAYFIDSAFLVFQYTINPNDKQKYLDEGKVRFNGYLKLKEQFIKEQSLPKVMC